MLQCSRKHSKFWPIHSLVTFCPGNASITKFCVKILAYKEACIPNFKAIASVITKMWVFNKFFHFFYIYHKFIIQLSSKVTFACIPDVFCMHSGKKAWQLCKSCCSFIMRFCACMDASCARFGHILHASQTCPAHVLDASRMRSRPMQMLPWSWAVL